VLYDTLIRLGYDGEVPIYRCRLSMVDDLNICETSMMIPHNPVDPWTGTIADSETDTTIGQTVHVALTSKCRICLATTAVMPIALFPIWNLENPVWK
jgi:hypothetical protein